MNFSTLYPAGSRHGWLTIVEGYQGERPRGRTGYRYKTVCQCGKAHDVSYENLRFGRVIACRACCKAARREEMGDES